ncbi:MAG TPA: hypothetical protein V6C57_00575 [Coleofasciculaceae cyanobacterium]
MTRYLKSILKDVEVMGCSPENFPVMAESITAPVMAESVAANFQSLDLAP